MSPDVAQVRPSLSENVRHEQRVDAGLAECDDHVEGRADDRLAVVEGRIDQERHPGSRMEEDMSA
jgi:hypothetical protein